MFMYMYTRIYVYTYICIMYKIYRYRSHYFLLGAKYRTSQYILGRRFRVFSSVKASNTHACTHTDYTHAYIRTHTHRLHIYFARRDLMPIGGEIRSDRRILPLGWQDPRRLTANRYALAIFAVDHRQGRSLPRIRRSI